MWWRARPHVTLAAIETRLDAEREQLPPLAARRLPGLGIAAWFALPARADWIAFLLGATSIALVAALGWQATRLGRSAAFFAGFAVLGMTLIWVRAEWLTAPRLDRPAIAQVTGTIETVEPLEARGIVRLLRATRSGRRPSTYVRVNVAKADAPSGLTPGMRVTRSRPA